MSPNAFLHSTDHDGIKNYYSFAYQIANSDEAFQFGGMNYPYGEHVVYTDGQPFFTFFLRLFPFIAGYEIGILNSFMFLSILITAWLLWQILKDIGVSPWIAAAGAYSLTILSPQFYRLKSHYALSYSWIIPLFIFLLIRFYKSNKKIQMAVVISLVNLAVFFIHPYMGLMCFMFSVLTVFLLLFQSSLCRKSVFYCLLIIASSAPLFKLILLLTDIHINRPENPHGFFENYALLETVFVSYFPPFRHFMAQIFPTMMGQPWEGWAYVGIGAIFTIVITVLVMVSRMILVKKISPIKLPGGLTILLFPALLLLLFSMLIPLRWVPEEWVAHLGFIKQFRSVGRFAWVFYYVFGIVAVWFLHVFYQRTLNMWRFIPILAVFSFSALYTIEANQPYSFFSSGIGQSKNEFRADLLSEELKIIVQKASPINAQAILPLPFYHVGSEHTTREGTAKIHHASMILAYHLKKPILGNFLSRTSVTETAASFNVLAPVFWPKKDVEQFNKNPILIIHSNEDLDKYEQDLLSRAKLIHSGSGLSLYMIAKQELLHVDMSSVVEDISTLTRKNHKTNSFYTDSVSLFFTQDFENTPCDTSFAGGGAYRGKKGLYNILASVVPDTTMKFEASFWFYKGYAGIYNTTIFVEEVDTIGNQTTWISVVDVRTFPVTRGPWVMIELSFDSRKGPYKYCLVAKGPDREKGNIYVDNIVITQPNTSYFTKATNWVSDADILYKNYPLSLPK